MCYLLFFVEVCLFWLDFIFLLVEIVLKSIYITESCINPVTKAQIH